MAASIASYPQGYQPSAVQSQSFQVPPAATSSLTEDPLLTALREYITTGANASNVTTDDLFAIYQNETSQPGGKANLEALISTSKCVDCRIWKNSSPVSGRIELTITKFRFTLGVKLGEIGIPLSVNGSASGLFEPKIVSVNRTLFYDDISELGGSCEFLAYRDHGEFHISFTRNGKKFAAAVVEPLNFFFPYPKSGTAEWAQ